jgi:hypothetical protein
MKEILGREYIEHPPSIHQINRGTTNSRATHVTQALSTHEMPPPRLHYSKVDAYGSIYRNLKGPPNPFEVPLPDTPVERTTYASLNECPLLNLEDLDSFSMVSTRPSTPQHNPNSPYQPTTSAYLPSMDQLYHHEDNDIDMENPTTGINPSSDTPYVLVNRKNKKKSKKRTKRDLMRRVTEICQTPLSSIMCT